MSLWRIAWRNLWHRPLVTALTVLGVALGVALVCAVLTLRRETERTFVNESGTFDLVVGAKGSPLQLVLSSVYHLDQPTGNIPYARYEALAQDKRIRAAAPLGLGDNYRGYRIVGTSTGFFALERFEARTQVRRPLLTLALGRLFEKDQEAVLGAEVAQQTGLQLGQTFVGSHGLLHVPGASEHGDFPYTVVGQLAPSGTANDRAIFVPLPSVWAVHDQEQAQHRRLAGLPADATAPREVTAVLLQLHAVGLRLWLADEIQRTTESMAAIPINEMLRLYQQVLGPLQRALLAVAGLVVVVSSLSILTTLYQAAERRRHELAVLRSLGAHPLEIFCLVLMEACLLTVLGIACGWLAGHGGVQLAGQYLQQSLGLAVRAWTLDPVELLAMAAIGLCGVLAGVAPAVIAYRRSPATDLAAG